MDALYIIAMIGEMVSQMSLSSHVGRGSSGHCFAGDFLMSAATSYADTGLKVASGTSALLSLMVGVL